MEEMDKGMDKTDILEGDSMNVTLAGLSGEHLTGCQLHSHSDWELVIFLKGCGVHTVGEQKIEFHPGLIVCQPPDVPHGTSGYGEYQDLYVRLEGYSSPNSEMLPIFEDDEEKRFETLARMLYEAFHRRESNWRALVDALSDALSQLLIGWTNRRRETPAIEAAIRDMILNIANPDFDLTDMIKRSGYCGDHFRRCFRTATGETPAQYMIRLRIDHAKRILTAEGEASVREAAVLSGYQDPYYFSRVFRKHTGMSPSDYVRSVRNAELA